MCNSTRLTYINKCLSKVRVSYHLVVLPGATHTVFWHLTVSYFAHSRGISFQHTHKAQKHSRRWNNLLGVYFATFLGWCCLVFRMRANHVCSLFTFSISYNARLLLDNVRKLPNILCLSLFTNQRDLRAKSRNCIIFGVCLLWARDKIP